MCTVRRTVCVTFLSILSRSLRFAQERVKGFVSRKNAKEGGKREIREMSDRERMRKDDRGRR